MRMALNIKLEKILIIQVMMDGTLGDEVCYRLQEEVIMRLYKIQSIH